MQKVKKLLTIEDESISSYDLRRANLLSSITSFSIVLSLLLITSNFILARHTQLLMVIGFVLFIFLPTLLIQQRKHYAFARNYFCISQLTGMTAACIYNINSQVFVHSENIYLILAPAFVILYERKFKAFFYLLTILTFFSIRLFDFYSRSAPLDDIFFISSTIYLVVFLAIYYFINSYMNAFYRVCSYQNHLIDQMAIQKNRLEKTNATKNKLFSIISQDLKQPVRMLSNLLQLDGEIPEEKLKNHRKQVEENVIQINTLIETVLTWAKSQLEGFEIRIELVSIDDIIQNELDRLAEEAQKKNIQILDKIPTGLSLESDANHIGLVLRNIISNCIKFSSTNGLIEIEVLDHEYYIDIVITDHGVGMDNITVEKILKGKFISSNSKANGSGLGLTLCAETLEKIGGTLLIESTVKYGTKYTVQLSKSISSSQNARYHKTQVSP